MATINYYLRGTKKVKKLHCRFLNSRSIDVWTSLNIFIDEKNWDKKNQKIKNVLEIRNRNKINKNLALLKINLLDEFNDSFMNGEIIDKQWVDKKIADQFGRPKDEQNNKNLDHTIYYTDYAYWWLENKSKSWLTSSTSYMNDRSKMQYASFNELVKRYEGKTKIKFQDISGDLLSKFVQFLSDDGYSPKTIQRHINRFRFFCARASEDNLKINNGYKKKVFAPKVSSIKYPYLNTNEIQQIYNLDLSDNDALDNVRDNLIIACYTCLRISDFNTRLDLSNFIDDYIEITTAKTNTSIVVPVHKFVKKILIKRNGNLPKKTSDKNFNEKVKEICRLADLTKPMKGRLFNSNLKRKVTGNYPKYELVSSHIGRRSFVTNLYGKLSNSDLIQLGGWSTEAMMLKYIQKSNRDSAIALKNHWEKTT